ncbi:MAG: DUF4175 family protein [Gemmatimonadetes bacterium]|nr:DUF4175 family protein [Gemmatimonadota bacterium]NIU52245.1 DUF4175 family protein [Gemmatimonadota bacterium]NIV25208.1 DUF4175 family protein [Gemmatimonadota bacterium]
MGAGLIVYLISAFGMDRLRFTPTAVTIFRISAYLALAGLIVRYLIWPLSRRVSDEQIALYLEEHEPSLEMHFTSAVEFAEREEEASEAYSRKMVERLVENAVERCSAIDGGRQVERPALARSSGWLAGSAFAALAVLLLSPPFVRHSTPFLVPWGRTAAESPYSIQVEPGNARVARGSELKVQARLVNFSSDEVEIAVQRASAGTWERVPMGLDDETGDYLFFLFDLEEETEYFVEAGGVRSPLFRVEVAELPYVEGLTLEYHFPSYTGLDPVRQENGGDIAALRGTEVRVWVTPTIPVAGAAIVVDDTDSLRLEPGPDGTLAGQLEVVSDGMYRVVFEMADGPPVVGSPDYLIDVLSDQPPSVSFSEPGRDINVTSIEEIFVEVEAQDDYGIRSLELIYSVNGGHEDTLSLYSGSRKHVSAGHTFYLEEIELEPGDFISYFARTSDDNRVSGRQTTVSDIYFMEVRPFDRSFRQSEQAGMPGGAPGGFQSSLARQQRDIIAATFNLVRDRDEYSDEEFEENLATLALAQGQLRGDVETLTARIRSRGIVGMDSSFAIIAEALPLAAEAMREAEERLGENRPQEALPPEQRALQQLQRAEAAFREVQVGRNQGGGGGGGSVDAEQLAELFELELDKQRNQYEQVQRDRQQQVNEQIDETLQKVQQLARRQQQENERLRAQASQSQGQASSGRSQRQLAEETEELARKLERLAREGSRPELEETARELREAAEEMRRAAANARNDGSAQGQAALDRLREARRRLEGSRAADLQREIDGALRRAERLAEDQQDVIEDVEGLEESDRYGSERMRRLMERKEEMAGEVADLEAQLDRLARESRSDQRDASRKLQEAADAIRDDKLEDKILYSRGVVQQRSQEYAENFEEGIARDIEGLRQRLEEASEAVGESEERRLARRLDEARDLTRALESLEERTRRQAEQAAEAARQQGGEGQPAEGEAQPRAEPSNLDSPDGRPGFAPRDVRQFRREFGERRRETEQLQRALEAEGIDASELDPIIDNLRRLESGDAFGDPRGLAELQAQLVRDLKEFEYVLRRELVGSEERELLLSGSDEVPAGYRELVDAYYKALAEERRQ